MPLVEADTGVDGTSNFIRLKNKRTSSNVALDLSHVACTINILSLYLMPLELSACDTTILTITLKSSIIILKASFTVKCDVYSTGVTYNYCLLLIVIRL
jgi:hypothetical protein